MNPTEPPGRRALIIHNPRAGRGKGRGLERRLAAAARATGWQVEIHSTRRAGHEVELARAARREGWPVVIASGGDGTVHGVVNGLLESGPTETIFGHVPVGSGNDYARVVGLRNVAVERNLPLILRGRERKLDLGRALGEYFVNSAGVGLGADVVREALTTSRLRGLPLYLWSAFKAFRRFEAVELTVAAREYTACARMTMLEIALGITVGGGFRLTPDARPDDGLFDVRVIREVGVPQFVRYLPRVLLGTHAALPPVSIFRTARLRVARDTGSLAVHLDGELRISPAPAVDVVLVPRHLRVLCAS